MLEANKNLGNGGNGMQGSGTGSAAKMIKELQGLQTSIVTGAGVSTNVAVTGILLADTIIGVANITDTTNHVFTVTSNGNIQSTDDTTAKQLLVTWMKKPV